MKYGAKYVSLKEDDPYTVTLERAIEVIEAKKVADANRIIQDFGVDDIQVLNGRYGPYITDKQRNARIPKDRDPKTLTLEECRALLAAAPIRPARGRFGRRGAAAKGKKAAAPAVDAAATSAAPEARGQSQGQAQGDAAKAAAANRHDCQPQVGAKPAKSSEASAKAPARRKARPHAQARVAMDARPAA